MSQFVPCFMPALPIIFFFFLEKLQTTTKHACWSFMNSKASAQGSEGNLLFLSSLFLSLSQAYSVGLHVALLPILCYTLMPRYNIFPPLITSELCNRITKLNSENINTEKNIDSVNCMLIFGKNNVKHVSDIAYNFVNYPP